MLTTSQVQADATVACLKHGARCVYDAAHKRMAGNPAPLAALGLFATTIAEADAMARVAFGLMSGNDKAADLASVTIAGAKL